MWGNAMKHIDILKALADSNRLAIMCYLRTGKKCACEIEQVLSISQSATSKHLTKLRMVGLITAEKSAQWVHYSIPKTIYSAYPYLEELLTSSSTYYVFDTSKTKDLKCD